MLFTAFYSATRAFAVLGLLAMLLTLAWLIGHALENLLEYDPCTVVSLITLNVSASEYPPLHRRLAHHTQRLSQ